MKLPRLDLNALSSLALKHAEKIGGVIVALVVAFLIWGGIDALRSLAVKDAESPQAVEQAVAQARAHIDREPQPPADLLPPRTPLAEAIDPWRMPLVPWKSGSAPWLEITDPPVVALIDNPLFEEAAKRGQPKVLPVEDLQAVAGLAVLPMKPQGTEPGRPAAGPKPKVKPKPPTTPARRPPRGGDPLAVDPSLMPPPEMPGPLGPGDPGRPGGFLESGRIVPYVVVTGLIPVAKQREEYRRLFSSCGYRDPRRDAPLWSDYEIDRGTVGPDGKETWTRIDLVALARQRLAEWGDITAVSVPTEYQLGGSDEARSRQTTPIGFCSPLPPRLDGTWELADLHPWVVDQIKERLAKSARGPETMPLDMPPEMPGPGFMPGPGSMPEGPGFVMPNEGPMGPVGPTDVRDGLPESRLFRFVDTAVEAGKSYRYRVRLKVWNPNYDKNPERMRPHLEDPKLALEPKLTSSDSDPSAAATVPDSTRILVAPLRRAEIKELKLRPGAATVEVLVLGPTKQTATLALRALVADPGAVVDVDEKLNLKNQKDRARGESVTTDRLLLDARGRQEDRREGPAEREKPPGAIPEPLDVICLRPDGSFELASLAESERTVAVYGPTLPTRFQPADARGQMGPGEFIPPGLPDPLARPRVGP